MNAEVLSVGTELLLGETTDTNATHISRRLAEAGIDVYYRGTVGDNFDRLVAALRAGVQRADLVIVTGGLGPTDDDITREAVAEVAGVALREDPEAVRSIRGFFEKRNRPWPPTNLKQAMVPERGQIIPNPHGTAPGLQIEIGNTRLVAVPGVPAEMEAMIDEQVMPLLLARRGRVREFIKSRRLHVTGIGESALVELIRPSLEAQTDPTIAPCASAGEVTLRLTTKTRSEEEARARLDALEAELRRQIGHHVFGSEDDTLESVVGDLLRERGLTIATAESCTGGLIASRLTDVPGSSDYYVGGTVTYSNEEKVRSLGVPEALIEKRGAVSEQVARAMAEGCRRTTGADLAVAATGIAGPTGGTETKPVGLVYLALAAAAGTFGQEQRFHGSRTDVKWRTSQAALDMARLLLLGLLKNGEAQWPR